MRFLPFHLVKLYIIYSDFFLKKNALGMKGARRERIVEEESQSGDR